jgi:hypothetical protein
MMKKIKIGPVYAQYWEDEFPDHEVPCSESWVEKTVDAGSCSLPTVKSIRCLEVYRSFGPRILYGLLGATYELGDSKQFRIRVALTEAVCCRITGSLAPRFSNVWIGIPSNAMADIISAVSELQEERQLPEGRLSFSVGAYAVPGSPPELFRSIARCLALSCFESVDDFSERKLPELLVTEFG